MICDLRGDVTIQYVVAVHTSWCYYDYGMAMPRWLRTSLANSCAGDGVAALALLRRDYDANDVNDRATALQLLQASYISARNDVSEDDLRHQFDNMQIACNDIVRAGGEASCG